MNPTDGEALAVAAGVLDAVAGIAFDLYGPTARNESTLSRSQLAVLQALAEREEFGMLELAAAVGVTGPTMTATVKLLVKKGYITRRHSDENWRSVRISITERGRQAREQAVRQRVETLAQAIAGLSAEQRAMLMIALPALRALAARVRSA